MCVCVCVCVSQLIVIIGLTHALVVSRLVVRVFLSEQDHWGLLKKHADSAAVMLGAILHYITMQVMTRVRVHDLWLSNTTHHSPDDHRKGILLKEIFYIQHTYSIHTAHMQYT